MEPAEPEGGDARGLLPRRQLRPRADGPVRDGAVPQRTPAARQLVPVPGAGLAAVPALPEPAGDAHRPRRAPHRSRRGVPLDAVPAPVGLADRDLPVGAAPRRRPAGRRRGGRDVSVPGEQERDRLRAERIRVDRVRRLDTAVGVADAAAGVGVQLASDPRRPAPVRRRRARVADDRAALRDRLPGAPPAAAVAVRLRPVDRDERAASHDRRRRSPARGRVGDRAADRPAPMGRHQRGAARHRALRRLRRGAGARLAGLGAAARSRADSGRDGVRGDRPRRGARPLAGGPRLARARPGARRLPVAVVRADHVRIARRRGPRQRRHLLPPVHDGRSARRAAAGRPRRRVVRRLGVERARAAGVAPACRPARGASPAPRAGGGRTRAWAGSGRRSPSAG